MLSSLFVLSLAALAPLAHANVFVTHPTEGVKIPAGQPFQITWQDDGKAPNLTAFGPATVGLFVGSVNQQTQLQSIGNVDVSQQTSISWTPDATVGPNFDSYFIRITSVNLKDANQTQFNAEAFSAKFTLSGMTGTFNSTIQAQISGAASSGAASTAAATSASTRPSGASASTASTTKPNAAASSAAGSSKNNGAGHMVVPRVLGATGVAAIVFAFFL